MNPSFKSLIVFLAIFCLPMNLIGESDPHKFIDSQAQEMVSIIINNQELFDENPELFSSYFLEDNYHFSFLGNKFVANYIYEEIIKFP